MFSNLKDAEFQINVKATYIIHFVSQLNVLRGVDKKLQRKQMYHNKLLVNGLEKGSIIICSYID
jgi:hypothetical protein